MKDHVIAVYDYTEPGCVIFRGDNLGDVVRQALDWLAGDSEDSTETAMAEDPEFADLWNDPSQPNAILTLGSVAQAYDHGIAYDGPEGAS